MSDLAARLRESMTPCDNCNHPAALHSREPGVGCLHRMPPRPPYNLYPGCPCLRPGTSRADQ